MKPQEFNKNSFFETYKTPILVAAMIIGSPFFAVYKLVNWASELSTRIEKSNTNREELVLG